MEFQLVIKKTQQLKTHFSGRKKVRKLSSLLPPKKGKVESPWISIFMSTPTFPLFSPLGSAKSHSILFLLPPPPPLSYSFVMTMPPPRPCDGEGLPPSPPPTHISQKKKAKKARNYCSDAEVRKGKGRKKTSPCRLDASVQNVSHKKLRTYKGHN